MAPPPPVVVLLALADLVVDVNLARGRGQHVYLQYDTIQLTRLTKPIFLDNLFLADTTKTSL